MPFVIGIEGNFNTTITNMVLKKYNAILIDTEALYRIVASLFLQKELNYSQFEYLISVQSINDIQQNLGLYYNFNKKSYNIIPEDIYSPKIKELSTFIATKTDNRWYYYFHFLVNQLLIDDENVIMIGQNLLKMYHYFNAHIYLKAGIEKTDELMINEKTIVIDVSDKNSEDVFELIVDEIENRIKV